MKGPIFNVEELRCDFMKLGYVMVGLPIKNLKNITPNHINHESQKNGDIARSLMKLITLLVSD